MTPQVRLTLFRPSSCAPRFASGRSPQPNSQPNLGNLAPLAHSDDYFRKENSGYDRTVFKRLGIRSTFEKSVYERIPGPGHLEAFKYFYAKYSPHHIVEQYHMQPFYRPGGHPEAVALAHYYEKKKKREPLWHIFGGAHSFGRASLVIRAKNQFLKALGKALWVRGYDIYGRRISGDSVGDMTLRGTVGFYAKLPKELRTQVTMKEIQEAVDFAVDHIIKRALPTSKWKLVPRNPEDFPVISRRNINLERRKLELDPSLRELPYRPVLRKKDMVSPDAAQKQREDGPAAKQTLTSATPGSDRRPVP
ncbi:hypothetical protein CSOJ01_01891 [Colletotrichum sojae]|uniref:Uncharacterized protein n=1 Tax=Colletotrichum sojae TaxID=2175907 RepID=A0A8H6JSZ8_9PEZI|nr:hypothetical protein CSOJ01_01891 [Colletotrichum sojae]